MFLNFIAAVPSYAVPNITSPQSPVTNVTAVVETRIEDGKLLYEKRW